MNTKQILKVIDKFAPLSSQDDWDNSGVQICTSDKEIKRALIALDITDAVIKEAIDNNIDLIITHHPLLFYPYQTVDVEFNPDRYIIKLVQYDINVISFHTPFDKAKGGINDYFLNKLGLKNIKAIDEYVRVGSFAKGIKLKDLAKKIANVSKQEGFVKVQGDPDTIIKSVGMCSGSGGDMFHKALSYGADVYISGDIKHSVALEAKDCGICLIDAGHYGTENCFIDDMYELLSDKLKGKVKLYKTKTNQNPFDYTV